MSYPHDLSKVDRAFINLDDCDFDSRNSYSGDKVIE